jgi:Ankyrin repeats (3 copies)
MPARDLPARPSLEQYKKQAKDLLKNCKAGDPEALRRMQEYHRSGKVKPDSPRGRPFTLADAQFVIAREHGFASWPKFVRQLETPSGADSLGAVWKAAEDAVVTGDLPTLEHLLREHPQLLREQQPRSSWLGGLTPDYSAGDARTIIVRNHDFENWDQFVSYAEALRDPASSVARFERAVDAIVTGDADSLGRLLHQSPELIQMRSSRTHHATLLHYVGANGVEGFRQRTPPNAVRIAEILLDAGAEVDAGADMYGGGSTTLGLVATSIHPKQAGVLHPLIDVFLARGARVDARGAGNSHLLVNGCLANGRQDAAEFLAGRGAPLDLEGAAGVGRLDIVRSFFNPDGRLKDTATIAQMEDGFTWACEYGRTEIVEYLLDRGIDVGASLSRPHGQTGLHWAAHGGHLDIVKALLKRHAPVDVKDRRFGATPLGWALHGWSVARTEEAADAAYYEVVRLLVGAGAYVEPKWLSAENAQVNPRMFDALSRETSES